MDIHELANWPIKANLLVSILGEILVNVLGLIGVTKESSGFTDNLVNMFVRSRSIDSPGATLDEGQYCFQTNKHRGAT